MAENIRIKAWADAHGVTSKVVISALFSMGYPGKTASSNVPQQAISALESRIKSMTKKPEPPKKPDASASDKTPVSQQAKPSPSQTVRREERPAQASAPKPAAPRIEPISQKPQTSAPAPKPAASPVSSAPSPSQPSVPQSKPIAPGFTPPQSKPIAPGFTPRPPGTPYRPTGPSYRAGTPYRGQQGGGYSRPGDRSGTPYRSQQGSGYSRPGDHSGTPYRGQQGGGYSSRPGDRSGYSRPGDRSVTPYRGSQNSGMGQRPAGFGHHASQSGSSNGAGRPAFRSGDAPRPSAGGGFSAAPMGKSSFSERDRGSRRDRDRGHDRGRDHDREMEREERQQANPFASTMGEIVPMGDGREVHIKAPVIVKGLAEALSRKPNEVITALMMMNVLASINQTVDNDTAVKLAAKFGFKLVIDRRDKEIHQLKESLAEEGSEVAPEDKVYESKESDLKPRPPIVTFMGHVDHGKTSLQDAIRKTHVADGEAGGITQNIGASVVNLNGRQITFIDTPGHEAFTQMRARGANVTDLVVLVVAADDGFMPQTIEAMNHAKAANVPIIVAVNKMDLPDANPDKALRNMQQHGLMPEEWGGDVAAIRVSARTGAGIDDLLERILLEAEILELKANPKNPGQAYVLESELEPGLGPTASIVVRNGTVRVGDPVICGCHYGKIRTLIDHRGHRVPLAGPSTPVKVVGLSGVPEAGTRMAVCSSLNEAKELAESRSASARNEALANRAQGASLEDMFSQMADGKRNNLKVVVKADVRGSCEAIVESLKKLPSEKISVEVLHSDVGAITENDVLLAASAGAIVIGFHVRVNPGVNDVAKKSKVEIRLYSIIYELIEDITDALAGRLEPEKREKELGEVKILKIFNLSKGPKICGCLVERGLVKVGAKARVYRGSELIFNGEVRSLRHFQDDVKEMHAGQECGIRLDNFADFMEGDVIQLYEIELRKATL